MVTQDAGRRPRALVVDDDPATRVRARHELAALGFEVCEAANGAEALDLVQQTSPDLVLLDVQMPELDGLETCRELRRRPGGSEVLVLMMTGSEDERAIEQAFEAGASDFAAKPLSWPLLRHRVRFLVRAGDAFAGLRRTLDELGDSERRLEDAQALAHIGSWEWNLNTGSMLWSEETYRLLGLRPAEVRPHPDVLRAAIHPGDRAAWDAAIEAATRQGASWSVDHRLVRGADLRFVHHRGRLDDGTGHAGPRLLGTLQDVTERRETEERIRHLALYDSLTGLPNRRFFGDRLEKALRFAREHNRLMALLFVDLDRFKWVNDTFGHSMGDRVLAATAERILGSLRLGDGAFRITDNESSRFAARVGGDEFIVTLMLRDDVEAAGNVARRLLDEVSRPMLVDVREISVTASIGIALFPLDTDTAEGLVRHADAAMYEAKASGRNGYQYYRKSLNAAAKRVFSVQMGLRRALERGTLSLHYQPEVEAVSKQVRALEALLRWELPGARAVPPNEFIAIAEDCGLIFPIGEFALRRACEDCLTWQRDGLSGVRVAVNLSPVQLQRQPIVELVARVLGETGLPPSLLELELTETAVIADLAAVTRTLEGLKSLGVRLALDDFGTGYSALAYLRRLPLDALKIDREFITDVGTNPAATAIVAAITAVADRLGLEVVAEGVETQLQERIAREEGCNLLQGFRFARPAPISQLMAQLVATGGGPRAVAANT